MEKLFIILIFAGLWCCNHSGPNSLNAARLDNPNPPPDSSIVTGADQTELYFPLLKDKKIGIVANQTSICVNTHLVDTIVASGFEVSIIFCPEHGFRGEVDAGDAIESGIDLKTGIAIESLYGENKKPKAEQLQLVDIIIFDIQDVGARFYTYISTLHYVMQACAENNIPLILLDRPNPNGHYVDGPVLDTAYRSFIGMHSVPIVHGMTIGEYAQMINGENWINTANRCNLKVILCKNYNHNTRYHVPVKPSPNLPNDRSIELYPSLCLFEGTCMSIGRGTDMQFQIIGHPLLNNWDEAGFIFYPIPQPGAAKPVLNRELCYGFDLRNTWAPFKNFESQINLDALIKIYNNFPDKKNFFNKSFQLLAGNNILQKQIENGLSEDEIRQSWQEDLNHFKTIRNKYLLYNE